MPRPRQRVATIDRTRFFEPAPTIPTPWLVRSPNRRGSTVARMAGGKADTRSQSPHSGRYTPPAMPGQYRTGCANLFGGSWAISSAPLLSPTAALRIPCPLQVTGALPSGERTSSRIGLKRKRTASDVVITHPVWVVEHHL